jgi:hypothetical protein
MKETEIRREWHEKITADEMHEKNTADFFLALRAKELGEIRGKLPKERFIGERTHCSTCGGHIAAGECECGGYNQYRKEVLALLDELIEKPQ